MYHLELRQFPHNLCRFNMTEEELRATVLERWVKDLWVELEDRKWIPHHATLTVLEGPRMELGQLTMGRGWRTAQRKGRDVTAELLDAVKRELGEAAAVDRGSDATAAAGGGLSSGAGGGGQAETERVTGSPEADLVADSLGLELLSRIGAERAPLQRAWELAGARHPGGSASESLAIAERAVRSLLRSGLVVLLIVDAPEGESRPLGREAAELALAAIESWHGGQGRSVRIWIDKV